MDEVGSGASRGYVSGPWGQVHYRRAGDGGPALVLFHESPQSSALFEPALPLLGRGLRVWALDTPGYGASDPPPTEQEIPAYARCLLGAVEGLGLSRFAVAGVHTGASIALEVARTAGPDHVPGVVLTGVPVLSEAERREYLEGWSPAVSPTAAGDHMAWAWDRYVRIWGVDTDPALLTLGALNLLAVLPRYHWAYNAAFRHDPAPALRALRVPTLLLNAEHDLLAHTDHRALDLLADGRLEVVPGLRGQLPWRAPAAYANALTAFLAAL